ncbi:hypothetical protein [uncultured Thiodictyon sp.]|uniref:hypothetical protein n=1 Tax=uncultured Thiodictyon sp. TaxID=1846217 RepID=UPI0025F42BF6|nr:hypothetical protein [uncultured Thiodictyon sp.]
MSDFVPPSHSAFIGWHDNATAQAKDPESCVAPEDLAQLEADNAELHSADTALNLAVTMHKQAVAHNNTVHERAERNVRLIMHRVKAHQKFTPAVSARLRLQGPALSVKLAESKPNLAGADHSDGEVELTCLKLTSDGVNIYCQREGDAGWVLLGFTTVLPYFDRRPLLVPGKPELRRYTAVYVVKNKEIGQFSDEVVVNCAP